MNNATKGTAYIVGIVENVKKGRSENGTHWILIRLKTPRTEIDVKAFGFSQDINQIDEDIKPGMEVSAKGRLIGRSSHYIQVSPGNIRIISEVEQRVYAGNLQNR